jgi:urease accessory protein
VRAASIVLIIQRLADHAAPCTAELVLPWELRQKARLRTALDSGEEVGLFLPRGTVLGDGDRLQADDGRVIRVTAAVEPLMEARCDDAGTFARCAYHLGNRHTPVQIVAGGSGGRLRFPADPVLQSMLIGLGAAVDQLSAAFTPEAGAYAAGHHSHSGEQKHSGIIHDQFGHRSR